MTRQTFLDILASHGWTYSWLYDGFCGPPIIYIIGDNLGAHEAIIAPVPAAGECHRKTLEDLYGMIGASYEGTGRRGVA